MSSESLSPRSRWYFPAARDRPKAFSLISPVVARQRPRRERSSNPLFHPLTSERTTEASRAKAGSQPLFSQRKITRTLFGADREPSAALPRALSPETEQTELLGNEKPREARIPPCGRAGHLWPGGPNATFRDTGQPTER